MCNPKNPMYDITLESITNDEEDDDNPTLFQQRSITQRMKSVWDRNKIDLEKLWLEEPAESPP